jgi:hypothetical protein
LEYYPERILYRNCLVESLYESEFVATIFMVNPRVRTTGIKTRRYLVAGATAATAASAAAGGRGEGFGGAAGRCGTKDGEPDGGFFAGALRAGDLLLLVDYDFFEFGLAVVADVFVNGHL